MSTNKKNRTSNKMDITDLLNPLFKIAVSYFTNNTFDTISGTLDLISQIAEKRKLQYSYSLEEFEKELQAKLVNSDEQFIHTNVQDSIQALYNQTYNNDLLLLNSEDERIRHYFDIYKSFEMKSISNVTANKCIVDPLGNPISDIKNIRIEVSEVNDWMLNELNKNPTDLYQLSSRRFEELIVEIFIRKGYNVELTPATRDGGKDIYVASKNDFGSFLYVVECKKYDPNHKVGVKVLRDLYGVLSKERATYGIAVTTSYFSKPAKEFQQDLQYQMSLHDFDSIKKWLCDVT